jgi:hypothetical protein
MDERLVKISEVKSLVGSLMTTIEAMFNNEVQCNSAKIIVKQTVFRWFKKEERTRND